MIEADHIWISTRMVFSARTDHSLCFSKPQGGLASNTYYVIVPLCYNCTMLETQRVKLWERRPVFYAISSTSQTSTHKRNHLHQWKMHQAFESLVTKFPRGLLDRCTQAFAMRLFDMVTVKVWMSINRACWLAAENCRQRVWYIFILECESQLLRSFRQHFLAI